MVSAPGPALTVGRPPDAPSGPGPAWPRATGWARAHAALMVLMLVPFVVLASPLLFGNVFLDGDNFIQNFPLRALVGRDLGHGMLPLWNSYLFSGTPLLAGFNAGAVFPATWLMAVMPAFTAWTLSFAAVYDIGLVGMYLFLRRQGICPTAATFGAATFSFAGYMSAQIVHVDLIQGAAWLPWMLLAVHGLTERDDHPTGARAGIGRARRWVALLAVASGLSALSGGVEAIIDGVVVVLIYWGGRLVTLDYLRRDGRRTLVTPVVTLVLGLTGGAILGAAQWIPGGIFAAHSQRTGSSYDFFTSGSLPGRLITLLDAPFVLGTNQNEPAFYAGPYNFPEVTSYVGILALIAACVLLVRRWRTRPQSHHWQVWYVILLVGLVSALGNQTYFGRVLYLVPGLNSQRLLNRNLLLVDCSLAVLLAWWSHLMLTTPDAPVAMSPGRAPSTVRGWWKAGRRAELVATCAPFALSALLCLALWVAGPLLDKFLEASMPVSEVTRFKLAVLVTAGTMIAGAATWIVLARARFSAKTLGRLLGTVLAADLVLFNVFMLRPPVGQAQAQAKGPAAAAFTSAVGDGRFIIYDPDRFYGDQLLAMGQTDLNIFNRVPSAQGYTALTDGDYYQATGAHLQEDLRPTTLAGPVWDTLNVTTLLSLPAYFVTPAAPVPAATAAAANVIPFPTNVLGGHLRPVHSAPPPSGTDGPFPVARDAVRRWYFGGVLTVGSWSLPLDGGEAQGLRVGLLSVTGRVRWLPSTAVHRSGRAGHRTIEVSLPAPTPAGGVVIQVGPSGHLVVGAPSARTAEAGEVILDGLMQAGVTHPHWTFTGTLGPFGVFRNTDARGWAWLENPSGTTAPAGSTVSAAAPGPGGGQRIAVHATSALALIRSESWATGWQATLRAAPRPGSRPSDGRPVPATVTKDGLAQRVAVPGRGDYLFTFTYAPASVPVGIVVSAAATTGLVLWGVAEVIRWWWRRRRRPRLDPGGPEVIPG